MSESLRPRLSELAPRQGAGEAHALSWTWEFSPTWFVQDVWTKNEAFLRESAIKILNDDIASSAAVP